MTSTVTAAFADGGSRLRPAETLARVNPTSVSTVRPTAPATTRPSRRSTSGRVSGGRPRRATAQKRAAITATYTTAQTPKYHQARPATDRAWGPTGFSIDWVPPQPAAARATQAAAALLVIGDP